MLANRLRFGAFLPPHHPIHENPTLAIERDLKLVSWLDELGFEEAWIGEHHSGGDEIIASPEVFIAAAAERTKYIRLGTGVSSLPYHHPLILADRINQLDHQTRGRVMFGVGPGALSSDAYMMGITVARQRDMMDEALAVILQLLNGEEVTYECDWFKLKNARLQLTPYSRPRIEVAVASVVSPTGVRAAGQHGLGVLSLSATSPAGFNALASQWAIAEEHARENGKTMDRSSWRLVGPMHIAETRRQARKDLEFGLKGWVEYFRNIGNLPIVPAASGVQTDPVEAFLATGMAFVGTSDDAVEKINQLKEVSGGFGCFLFMAHNWANFNATKRSYELFARYVAPRFQQLNDNREASQSWVRGHGAEFRPQARAAVVDRVRRHALERGTEHIRPDVAALLANEIPKENK